MLLEYITEGRGLLEWINTAKISLNSKFESKLWAQKKVMEDQNLVMKISK